MGGMNRNNALKILIIVLLAIVVIIVFSYVWLTEHQSSIKQAFSPEESATNACPNFCRNALSNRQDISNGPCLSNDIAPDWVCDVAHNPREAIDDLPENQCSAYGNGTAHHFIEVDEKCNFIKSS